jgi:tRNA1(Val) A37 N6-methylase TrmN6
LGDNLNTTRAKHSSSNELKELIDLASNIISSSGDFWLILPYQLADFVIEIANNSNFYCQEIIRIHSKESKRNTRVILRFSKKIEQLFERDFFIRNEDNSYTLDYIELTKNFHFTDLNK